MPDPRYATVYVRTQVRVFLCLFRVEDNFQNRAYYLLDEALTWTEARAKCSTNNAGYLAMANSAEHFTFLKGMFDNYRSQGGSAEGAWVNGVYEYSRWLCHDYIYGLEAACPSVMPWTSGEPDNLPTEKCARVQHTKTDGLANYACTEKMPAICATFR